MTNSCGLGNVCNITGTWAKRGGTCRLCPPPLDPPLKGHDGCPFMSSIPTVLYKKTDSPCYVVDV